MPVLRLLRRLSFVAAASLPGSALIAQSPCDARFPMDVLADEGPDGGLELSLRADEILTLSRHDRVTFASVPLPNGTGVDVEVARIALDRSELVVLVDGVSSLPIADDTSMWMGRIAGEADSDVFLAFSGHGSRGWIRRAGETYHLLAGPGPDGDWSRSTSRLVPESRLLALGAHLVGCAGDALVVPGRRAPRPPSSTRATGSTGVGTQSLATTTLTCRMAIETDYQLFTRFNDLAAEQTYVTQLFAAGSARYEEQVHTVLQPVYFAYYTTNSDPWVAPDVGGNSVDTLYELQAYYAGNPPNGANLTALWSGQSLGGGVAWLDVLCDPNYGFSVSGNLTIQGGQTPFPVVQGPLTWDFVVTTHEVGHNFGTPHTHDFCPPIDQCAPSGYFGQCQTQQVCITNGTLMGYCHLCAGGMSNVYPYFAQACADLMRQRAEASCLTSACPVPTTFCPATFNTSGFPGAMSSSGSQAIAANTFTLIAGQLPPNKTAFFFYGSLQVQIPVGQGWRCVGGSVFRLRPAQNSGPGGGISRLLDFSQPPAGSGSGAIQAGATRYFQAYYRDPAGGGAGFNLTDALEAAFCP